MGNIQEIPPEVLASWPKPNLDNPVTRDWMPAFAMIWQVAATILVWGRFYLRVRRLAGPFGYDDAFILIAWMSSVAFTACAWVTTSRYGVDRHTWDVPVQLFSDAALMAWILQVLMLVASGATKASVLLFYRRLVVGTLDRRWRLAIYYALAFHALYVLGLTLGYVLVCRPLHAYWMSYDYSWDQPYTCSPYARAMNAVVGVLSVFSDVYAVVLPFIILRHYTLDVPRSQKIGLNIIFATGLLVAGAGIGRTYYLIKLGITYDTSWTGFDLLVWTIIELHLGIICACAPSLRAFFRRYLSHMFSQSSLSSRSKSRSKSAPHSVNDKPNHQQQSSSNNKETEPIDMQTLTQRSSEHEPRDESPEAPRRPKSPARTYHSRLTSEGADQTEITRWESDGRGSPWPITQEITVALHRAQSIHSPV